MQRNISQAEKNQLLMNRIRKRTNRFGIRESTSNKDHYFKNLLKKTNENGLQLQENNDTLNNIPVTVSEENQNKSVANNSSKRSNTAVNQSYLRGKM